MTRLMYVYDQTGETYREDLERAETVVEEVSATGIEVNAVCNRGHRSDDLMFDLEAQVGESDALWVDVPTIDIGRNTARLIGAAEEAGVLVLGKLDLQEAIQQIPRTDASPAWDGTITAPKVGYEGFD